MREGGSPQEFKHEQVILYRSVSTNRSGILKLYMVGDSVGRYSPKFAMGHYNTLVTKENIAVKFGDYKIVIIPGGGHSTFGIFTVLSPLADFSVSFNAR